MTGKLIVLAAALGATPALAQSFADLAAVDNAVAAFAGAPQGSPGGPARPIDRRLRLARCSTELALAWYGARRDTVEVRCPVPGGWKLYVPLSGGGSGQQSAAPVIMRGDAVTISVSGDGFAVSQPGEALENGAVGTWIKVRGPASAQAQTAPVMRARVLRPGVVGMELP